MLTSVKREESALYQSACFELKLTEDVKFLTPFCTYLFSLGLHRGDHTLHAVFLTAAC